jgi:hypothetical protein
MPFFRPHIAALAAFVTAALVSVPAFAAKAAQPLPPSVPDTTSAPVPATTYEAGLPPAQAGARLIQAFIAGDRPAQIAPFFDDAVAPSLTDEAVADFQSQLTWMSDILGDALQVFAEGHRTLPDGTPEYDREYRFANESDRRHPLILVQAQYSDSLTNKATGIFIKTFVPDQRERKLSEAQAWKIGERIVDVQSVSLLEFPSGFLLFVRVEDGDTASLDTREAALPHSAPVAREAVARGWIDSARASLGEESKPLLEEIGVLFMRVDPKLGYTHFRHTVLQEEYAVVKKPAAKKSAPAKAATKKGK